MRNVDVSVIIPVYNARNSIVAAVDSVLKQTFNGSIEIIIIDDGSTDNSTCVIEAYLKKLVIPRFSVLITQQINKGVSTARNSGIKLSKGKWLAFLDSDDIWMPEKLDTQFSVILSNPSIKFIGSNRNGEVYPYFRKKDQTVFNLNARQILLKWYPQTSTVLMSSDLCSKVYFDESMSHGEDGDLWLRVVNMTPLYVVNKDLVFTGDGKRHFGESGLSSNLPMMFNGELSNLSSALKRNQINSFEYLFFLCFFYLKYFRRIIITKLR